MGWGGLSLKRCQKDVKLSKRCQIVKKMSTCQCVMYAESRSGHIGTPMTSAVVICTFAKCSNIQKYYLKHPVDLLINIINDNNPQ